MSSRKRYAILTPFDRSDIMAAITVLHQVELDIVSTPSGVMLVREVPVPQFDDWDIAELFGDSPAPVGSPEPIVDPTASDSDALDSNDGVAVACVFSELSPYGVVLFSVDLGDDVGGEDGVSGLVKAQRFVAGKPSQELSSGLILNSLDEKVEAVVLGLQPLEELDLEVIHPDDAQLLVKAMVRAPEMIMGDSGDDVSDMRNTEKGSSVSGSSEE